MPSHSQAQSLLHSVHLSSNVLSGIGRLLSRKRLIFQFAQRLSSLVGENLGASPKYEHRKHLFYL